MEEDGTMSERPDLKIVELHDGRPLLNDIPGRLRALADQIEKGEEFGEVDFAFIILDAERPVPVCVGFGDLPTDRYILGLLDTAHEWFLRQVFDADDNLPESG
jgi:hypothetical protein